MALRNPIKIWNESVSKWMKSLPKSQLIKNIIQTRSKLAKTLLEVEMKRWTSLQTKQLWGAPF